MKYLLFFLLVLVACSGLEPDYFELGGGVKQGDINHPRNGNYGTQSESVGFVFGWNLGQQAKAMSNLANLDVSRAGELSFRDTGAQESSIIINNKKDDQMVSEEGETIPDQLAPTKTKEESYAFLLWAAGILVLAGAATILGKSGLKIPFLSKSSK